MNHPNLIFQRIQSIQGLAQLIPGRFESLGRFMVCAHGLTAKVASHEPLVWSPGFSRWVFHQSERLDIRKVPPAKAGTPNQALPGSRTVGRSKWNRRLPMNLVAADVRRLTFYSVRMLEPPHVGGYGSRSESHRR